FLKSTDGIIHMGSRNLLFPALRELDRRLTDLYRRNNGKMEIVAYSDHGNFMEACRRAMIERQLDRAGFKLKRRLRDSASIVAPAFGLCSYAALYTETDNLDGIAQAVSLTEGVDSRVYRRD